MYPSKKSQTKPITTANISKINPSKTSSTSRIPFGIYKVNNINKFSQSLPNSAYAIYSTNFFMLAIHSAGKDHKGNSMRNH